MQDNLPIYQISDLVHEMRRLMEASYPEVWVEGELSSLSMPASGHLYFSLKDDQSQLRCAMFKGRASINRYRPKVGDLVRVRAKISVYPARGDLQCIVQYMEDAGEGVLQRRFEELKQKLNDAGLFDANHKQALPRFAKRIGVVTSPSGAAIRDIISTLQRRCPNMPIVIYPAVVQGNTAAKSVIQAINNACQHQQCDVLIISRGGGSLEDLWCFNDEALAHAIYNCPIPVISGVGHEVDVSIADLVADVRAPTPTAAAELLSQDNTALEAQLRNLSVRLRSAIARQLQQRAQNADFQYARIIHPKQQLDSQYQQLIQLGHRLTRQRDQTLTAFNHQLKQYQQRLLNALPSQRINSQQKNLHQLSQRLRTAQAYQHRLYHTQFHALGDQLNLVSPLATLNRGFSITRGGIQDNANIIRSSKQLTPHQPVQIKFSSGLASCTVDKLEHDD